jgi:APA family basic amino acid/polyamine antiporter
MTPSPTLDPSRRLGLSAAFALVAGSMLGIGIFLAPVTMATHLNSVWVFIGVWVFTGLIALAGATSYAELGVMMPHSGGDYVFQRAALGPSVAFAYGWGLLSAGFAGSIAAMSVPLCTFQLGALTGWPVGEVALTLPWIGEVVWAQVAAMGLIALISVINIYGVSLSGHLQSLTTYVPLLALSALSLYVWTAPTPPLTTPTPPPPALTLSGLTSAFLEAYFAYSGWNAVIYAAGEVERPERTLPRALVWGTLVVMCLYLLLCGSALHSLSLDGLRALAVARQDIGSAMAAQVGAPWALTVVLVLISGALIASINATILGGGRVAMALARDGAFWAPAGRLHPRLGTPANALWAQAVMAELTVLIVPWELIFSVVSLVMVTGGALSVVSLYVLRRKDPGAPRPYRALGYPYLPALFVASGALVLGVKVWDAVSGVERAWHPIWGLGVVAAAYVIHSLRLRQGQRAPR